MATAVRSRRHCSPSLLLWRIRSSSSSSSSGQQQHHDLPSFLAYASRVKLPTTSTVYVGTHYEYTVRAALARLGMRLTRIGGRADAGIDLLGQWLAPWQQQQPQQQQQQQSSSLPLPLPILVQCKVLHRRPGPQLVRELEGAFSGAPPLVWRQQQRAAGGSFGGGGVLALLAVTHAATAGVRKAMRMSRLPLAFALVRPDDGRVLQFLWNRAASDAGLHSLGVTTRYVAASASSAAAAATTTSPNAATTTTTTNTTTTGTDTAAADATAASREEGGGGGAKEEGAVYAEEVALTWQGRILSPISPTAAATAAAIPLSELDFISRS